MRQNKQLLRVVAASVAFALALVGFAAPAVAEDYTSQWTVSFTAQKQMESTFRTGQIDESVNELQPGDSVTFQVTLANRYPAETDWYMENEVISSLERSQSVAKNGAYSYRLVYTGPDGTERVLYDSSGIGGDKDQRVGVGLEEATDSLDEMFYLDTLAQGQSGRVDLYVALEGETQGNAYQDTRANLQMDFAVELRETGTVVSQRSGLLPETGDPISYLPLVLLTGLGGLAVLIVAIVLWRRGEKETEEAGHGAH